MQATPKEFAVELFNLTLALIETDDRSQAEIERMIHATHAAHASRYHWEIAGGSVNIARGEWLISRVYALLGRDEPCLYHARRGLKLTHENDLEGVDLALGYEAMACAAKMTGNQVETGKGHTLAQEAGAQINDLDDQQYFFNERRTITPESEGKTH